MANVPNKVLPFWNKFQAATNKEVSLRFYEAFHFCDNESDCNALAKLVLAGTKRATASLLWTYEAEEKPLPIPTSLSVVTNWQKEPLCIIESTHVDIVPFDSVTERFAAVEGEGDKTLSYWREVHWEYFSRECERMGRAPELKMPVVCEEFRVVFPETY